MKYEKFKFVFNLINWVGTCCNRCQIMERLKINHGGKENLIVGQEMKIDYELFNLSKYCELYIISVCYYVKDEFK